MSVGVIVRVSAEQREHWKEQAALRGISVNQMIKASVTATLEEGRQTHEGTVEEDQQQ